MAMIGKIAVAFMLICIAILVFLLLVGIVVKVHQNIKIKKELKK